jgi:succinate dehydrogenase / fumarate reductase cytochrome b subunit
MKLLVRLFRSSLGKKYIMALSGAGLVLFAVGHMLGNLQVFLGPEPLNAYGHFLQSTPEILWGARLGLLGLVGLHIWAAVKLTLENRAARPVPYDQGELVAASYASRTMIWSGLIIAAFVLFHLLHYTVQVKAVNLTGQDFGLFEDTHVPPRHDIFKMMITGFRQPLVSGFYVLAVGLLCVHLSHGISAMFQSLGFKDKTWGPAIDKLAVLAAWVLFLGYSSIPVAILLGYGKEALR